MVLLSDECASLLNCNVKSIRDNYKHPISQGILHQALVGRKARTTYSNRNGEKVTIIIGGITTKGAHDIPAFGRLSRTFNISVTQYFFAHHGIKLHNPFHPCLIEIYPRGENRYYPLELMELIDEKSEYKITLPYSKDWLGNMFETIEDSKNGKKQSEEDSVDFDLESWRACCSQDAW
jgi:hypothetical protein